MTTITLATPDDFDGFRVAVRGLIAAGTPPEAVSWRVTGEAGDLLAGDAPVPRATAPELRVPKAFPDLARRVICNRDAERCGGHGEQKEKGDLGAAQANARLPLGARAVQSSEVLARARIGVISQATRRSFCHNVRSVHSYTLRNRFTR